MMERADIRIEGNVQMAGFRTFIKNIADSLNLKGFALEDGSIRVVCEGEEEGINELINLIKKNSPSFVRIEGMNVEYEEYREGFTCFTIHGVDIPIEEEEDIVLEYMRRLDKRADVVIDILTSMNNTLSA